MRITEDGILMIRQRTLESAGIAHEALNWLKYEERVTYRRAQPGQPAEIAWDTLPAHYREQYQLIAGCPYQSLSKDAIKAMLIPDKQALQFLQEYRSPKGQSLSKEHIAQYKAAAEWLTLLDQLLKTPKASFKILGAANAGEFYAEFAARLEQNQVKLPTNYAKLREKLRQFMQPAGSLNRNYAALISRKLANSNSQKLTPEAKEWLIAQYALPIKINHETLWLKYNEKAPTMGWLPLEDSKTIYTFLHRTEIQQKWSGGRHGFIDTWQRFGLQLKTELPGMRDSLWYADGTKLNLFYQEDGHKKADLMVYEVIDTYSEVLLGYHISNSENYEAQYMAFKQAIQTAGQQPYEIRYDNQGGHKMIKESFLDKLSHIGFHTQAYRGKAKTIESIFGRLQQQVMSKFWNFTGQNLTATSKDSKLNKEFLVQNAKHLPTKAQILKQYAQVREEWNNAPHPKTGVPRMQMYLESKNPKATIIDSFQMVELFWLTKEKPITYFAHGITLTFGARGKANYRKHIFEVYDNDGMVDMDFRSKYIDAQFIVKFDPNDMSEAWLYQDTPAGLRFVAVAKAAKTVHRNTQEITHDESVFLRNALSLDKQFKQDLKEQHRIREIATGVRAEDLLEGISLGSYDKQISLMDSEDPEETDIAKLI